MIAICIGTVGVVLYTFFWAWTVDSVEHAKEVNSMDKTKHIRMLFLFGILLNILILLIYIICAMIETKVKVKQANEAIYIMVRHRRS